MFFYVLTYLIFIFLFQAIIKKLQRRKSRREAKSLLSEVRNGTLRRTNSDEHLSEIDTTGGNRRHNDCGLPTNGASKGAGLNQFLNGDKFDSFGAWKDGRPATIYSSNDVNIEFMNSSGAAEGGKRLQTLHRRIRHNSEGNYDDVNFVQEALFTQHKSELPSEENIYENLIPLYSTEVNNNNKKSDIQNQSKFPLKAGNGTKLHGSTPKKGGSSGAAGRHLNIGVITPPLSSDTSSLDSHNDSGYSTRMGVSDGPSPLMCDTEPMLDPKAVFMIPKDVVANSPFVKASAAVVIPAQSVRNGGLAVNGGKVPAGFSSDDVVINKKSSFV
jgi:hypothetical protein